MSKPDKGVEKLNDHATYPNTYIAHIRPKDKKVQSVSEHLRAVQEGCEAFGNGIGVSHLAGLIGLLHDLGKNTPAFKAYIMEAAEHPDNPPRRGSVDHATAGGRLIYQRYHRPDASSLSHLTAEWVANCIISHHGGLHDYLSPDTKTPFLERVVVKTKGMEEYEGAVSTFWEEMTPGQLDDYFKEASRESKRALDTWKQKKLPRITLALLIKYLFSCLIDADRTDAREFEEDHRDPWITSHHDFFERSYARLMEKLDSYASDPESDLPINRLRRAMSQKCEEFAANPQGIYTLSIPTGGGKTLASLRFALKHALENKGIERIIYVAPYTTIIEQNADEIRKILKADDQILEHHSNVLEDLDFDDDHYDLRKKTLGLARDNWDRPLIFTSMVQFLNTFYAKGTRNARRLHRLSHSVLIFDEVQTVPPQCLSLFNAILNFLDTFGQSTSILCTATQPNLALVTKPLHLPENSEIIDGLGEVSQQFKRVEIRDLTTDSLGAADLAAFVGQRMEEINDVLVILNTKAAVRKLFLQLQASPWVKGKEVRLFHLSTNMCPAHRKEIFNEMKLALTDRQPVICVSTQLIEAGVNISFDCVIRSLAGLDSIAQAAGRCNRHGEDPLRVVYVVESSDEVLTNLPEIQAGADVTRRILSEFRVAPEKFGDDLLAPEAMAVYFRYYYTRIENELLYPIPELGKNLFDLLDRNQALWEEHRHFQGCDPEILNLQSFATAESYFHVIHETGRGVLVPYDDDAKQIIADMNGDVAPDDLGTLLRRAQQYVVNLYDRDIRALDRNGAIYPLLHGRVLALQCPAYTTDFGVDMTGTGTWTSEFA